MKLFTDILWGGFCFFSTYLLQNWLWKKPMSLAAEWPSLAAGSLAFGIVSVILSRLRPFLEKRHR